MTRAYGYIRTSTTEQLNKSGPKRQEEKMTAYAGANGIEIERFFVEDISGTTGHIKRPVFTDLLKHIFADGVDLILIEDLSRLARDTGVQIEIVKYLASKEIHLIAVNTGMDVVDDAKKDPTKRAMIDMQGVFNTWEKDNLVARLQRGRQMTGHKGGRPSYYPKELKRRIRSLRSKGDTYNHIADRLNLEDEKTSTGRPWTPQLVRIVSVGVKYDREPKRMSRRRSTTK